MVTFVTLDIRDGEYIHLPHKFTRKHRVRILAEGLSSGGESTETFFREKLGKTPYESTIGEGYKTMGRVEKILKKEPHKWEPCTLPSFEDPYLNKSKN